MSLSTITITELDRYTNGGQQVNANKREIITNTEEWRYTLVRYKSMDELIQENPNHYFDKYGNFNNGHITNEIIAPSYFSQMGQTLHRKYCVTETPKDEWYFKVID